MNIEIIFLKSFTYTIEIKASFKDGKLVYTAELAEGGFLSYFDHYEDYSGQTVEEALNKISCGIQKALDQMHEL